MKTITKIVKNPYFKTHKLEFINDGVGNFWVFRTIETQRSRIGHLSATGLEVDKEKRIIGNGAIVIQKAELIAIANFLKTNL
jgi:hypothetical protein